MNLRSVSLALVVLSLCASLPVFTHELILDGRVIFRPDGYFATNVDWREIVTGRFVMTARHARNDFHRAASGFYSYRPLTALVFWVEQRLAQGRPWVLHGMSVLWHVLCVGLLFRLARRLLAGQTVFAWLAAALFAVHPAHAEVLNNTGFQSDQLALLFGLWGLLILWAPADAAARLNIRRWIAALSSQGLFAAAALSKETGTIFFLLGWTALFMNRSVWPRRIRVVTVAVGLFFLAVYMAAYLTLGASDFYPKMRWFGDHWTTHIGVTAALAAGFVKAMIWPFTPCCLPSFHAPDPWPLGPALVWWLSGFVLLGCLVFFLRRCPVGLWCLSWVVLAWLPVSNIIPLPNPMGLRYLYIPSAGMAVLLALSLKAVAAGSHQPVIGRNVRIGVIMAGFVLIAVFAARLWRAHQVFIDEITALACVIRHHPESSWPYFVLAQRLASTGRTDEAIAAGRLFSDNPVRNPFVSDEQHRTLALTLLARLHHARDPRKAAWFYQKAFETSPGFPEACVGWCQALTLAGRHRRALSVCRLCLSCCPQERGVIHLIRGHNFAAVGEIRAALHAWMSAKQAGVSQADGDALFRWIRAVWKNQRGL